MKELGIIIYNCSCLALDLHRVFNLYWQLQYKDFVPSIWSKRLSTLWNKDENLPLLFNNTKAEVFLSVSDILTHGFILKARSVSLRCDLITKSLSFSMSGYIVREKLIPLLMYQCFFYHSERQAHLYIQLIYTVLRLGILWVFSC